jgi:hypothetical protein
VAKGLWESSRDRCRQVIVYTGDCQEEMNVLADLGTL